KCFKPEPNFLNKCTTLPSLPFPALDLAFFKSVSPCSLRLARSCADNGGTPTRVRMAEAFALPRNSATLLNSYIYFPDSRSRCVQYFSSGLCDRNGHSLFGKDGPEGFK